MELRDIYNECQEKTTLFNIIDNYFRNEIIPLDGKPYEIDDPEVFFNVISIGSAQAKAPEFEKYIQNKTGWKKIKPNMNRGDFYNIENDTYIELKTSFTNKGNNLNIRQIRLWQNVDYYLAIYVNHANIMNSKVYLLTHSQMAEEVASAGCATHGTVEANLNNVNIEYSIPIPIDGGEKQQRWDNIYYNEELFNLIFGK